MVSAVSQVGSGAREPVGIAKRLRAAVLRTEGGRAYALLSPNLIMLAIMLVVPLVGLIAVSFINQKGFELVWTGTLKNYGGIAALGWKEGAELFWMKIDWPFKNAIYSLLLFKSILMSLTVTTLVVLFAYPMAYFLAFHVTRHKIVWLVLITIPFWTSYLLRVFAWKIILGYQGVINSGLISLGLLDEPLEFLLYNSSSVVITLVHAWVAFAVLPIYVSLEKIDRSLLEAATDLGDTAFDRFRRVTLPLSAPGTIAAALLVFIPTVGEYVTPTIMGGTSGIMVGNVIVSLFTKANNWPLGSALSVTMMLTVTLMVCLFLWAIGYRRMRQAVAP